MEVKSELIDAQLQMVTTADEATLSRSLSKVYFNVETFEILVGTGLPSNALIPNDNTSFVRSKLVNQHVVGDIKASMLSLADFQSEMNDTTWELADGGSCVGTDYEAVSSNSTKPDLRGRFLRGKSHASGNSPDGDLPLGTFTDDKTDVNGMNSAGAGAHNHTFPQAASTGDSGFGFTDTTNGSEPIPLYSTSSVGNHSHPLTSSDNETSPKSVTINYFIKVNR